MLQVARDNVAVDAGLDLVQFASRASRLTERPLSLYTLPISGFGKDPNGSDINLVDLPAIRRIVNERFMSDAPAALDAASPTTQPPLAEPVILDVVNASSRDGLATALEEAFAGRGFTRGSATTAAAPADDSMIEYGPGAAQGAQILAEQLHVPAAAEDTVASGTVRLTVGARFPAADYLANPDAAGGSSASGQVSAVAATGTGDRAPAPTNLSQMTASSVPCVK
jgi:hypothetical protein